MKLRCLVIALVFLTAIASDSWGESKQQSPKASQQTTSQEERGTEKSPVVVKVLKAEKTPDELNSEKEKQESDRLLVSLTGDLAKYTKALFWATGFLGLITAGLVFVGFRQVRDAKRELEHARQIERAYLSGGGAPFLETIERIENIPGVMGGGTTQTRIERRPTGRFNLCVNNYGKTAAELRGFAVNFCDSSDIPTNPIYERRYWYDWILPGDRARHVTFIDIPTNGASTAAYGRFYYRDIFGQTYSTGFINRINRDNGESVPIDAPRAYTEEREE